MLNVNKIYVNNTLKQRPWLSIIDVAEKLKVTRATIIDLIKDNLLPQPTKLRIGCRELHWNADELELFLFKNAKASLQNDE